MGISAGAVTARGVERASARLQGSNSWNFLRTATEDILFPLIALPQKTVSGITKCASITKPGGAVSTEEDVCKFAAQRAAFRE